MNPAAPSQARAAFLRAALPGPSRQAAAVASQLAQLPVGEDRFVFDAGQLEAALDAEFPWRSPWVFGSRDPMPEECDVWVQTVRWLVQSMLEADMNVPGAARRVQIMFCALGFLDVGCAGLGAIAERFAGTPVPTSAASMLQQLVLTPHVADAASQSWLQELPVQVQAGNFKLLRQARRVVCPRFHGDIQTAVFLLWRLQPEELARLVHARNSIFLAIIVCTVLDADAPAFALHVENLMFKFISLSWLERVKGRDSENSSLAIQKQLLLQLARTSHWMGWLQATYEYPDVGSEASSALAQALAELGPQQWRAFIAALGPSTSRGAAEAVADILVPVSGKLGDVKTQPIWSAAFERWSAWNYGKGEGRAYLGSPQVCAFDFPVAMYYAQMPTAERDALAQELQNAIAHVELRWFASESELCSERNRLSSRLRLVRHGAALAAGGTEALPPPVHPDSDYAEVRYRYHDVNATLARKTGR